MQSNEFLRLNISGSPSLYAIADSLIQCFIEMLEFWGCVRPEVPLVGDTGPVFKHPKALMHDKDKKANYIEFGCYLGLLISSSQVFPGK